MAPRQQVYQNQITVPVTDVPQAQRVDVSSGLLQAAQVQRQREARQSNEMRLEALKSLEELKGQADALPFDQREAYFQTNAQKIKGEFGKRFGVLDFEAKGMFHDEFDQMFGLKSIDVQQSAKKGEEEHNFAVMEETLTRFEKEAAQAPTDAQRNFFMEQAGKTIGDAVVTGSINEVQAGDLGRNFKRKVEVNTVRAMIESDPSQGLLALNSNKFANLKEEDRLTLVSRAEQKIQHQVSMADHAAVVADRNRKRLGEAIAKEGFDLLAKGQLPPDWLDKNRAVLDTSDFRMIVNGMQEGGTPASAEAQSRLYRDIYVEGKDASEDILAAMKRGDINGAQAKALLNENQAASPAGRAKKFITQYLKPSDINPSVAQAQQYAEAIAEFDRRFSSDPKQDPMDLARVVVERNAFAEFSKMTAIMPLPDNAVGGRRDFDERATRAATTKAFMQKHNNDRAAVAADPAFKAEIKKIDAWVEATKRLEAGTGAGKKGGTK